MYGADCEQNLTKQSLNHYPILPRTPDLCLSPTFADAVSVGCHPLVMPNLAATYLAAPAMMMGLNLLQNC